MKYFIRKINNEQKPLSFTLQGALGTTLKNARKYSKYILSSSFETFQLLMMVGFEGSETYH